MFKIFILWMVLCLNSEYVFGTSDLTPEQKLMLKNLHNACVEETSAPENIIADAVKGNFADDVSLKCYMKCLMTSIGVLEEDGTMDFDAYLDLLPENYKSWGDKTVPKCRHIVPEGDACATAFKIQKCIYDADPAGYLLF